MLNSKIKNKIYTLVSISVLIIFIMSFFMTISFLTKIKKLATDTDKKLIEENTTILNIDQYNNFKEKSKL